MDPMTMDPTTTDPMTMDPATTNPISVDPTDRVHRQQIGIKRQWVRKQ